MKLILRAITKLITLVIVLGVTLGIGLGLYATSLLKDLPTVEEIRRIKLNAPLRIYSRDNKLIGEYGNERRTLVTLDQTPPLLVDALLATEDDDFFNHTGVDFTGLLRAVLSNLQSGSKKQGASTITMQVVRNYFLNPEKTYTRKLKEILLSFSLERKLTKSEILELYLNKIFLGHRAYGFSAAAQVYYNTALEDLSVPEIAMLAGLPKAPSRDNPIPNPKRARERRDYVLYRLHALGKIDQFTLNAARKAPVTARQYRVRIELDAPYVAEMARQIMLDNFGEKSYDNGYNVYLTVDSRYQQKAFSALRQGLIDYDIRHGYRGRVGHLELSRLNQQQIQAALEQLPSSYELKPAVVTLVDQKSIEVLDTQLQRVTLEWDGLKWARRHINANSIGTEPKKAADIVAAGDIIYLKQVTGQAASLAQLPEVSGAIVSLNPQNGAILALSGGFDYYLSKFNRATQAERQPGSNIKPFIYSAALTRGFHPASLVSGAPIIVEDELEGIWRPQNYSKKVFGPTRLRKALSLSLNLVSVRLLRAIGIDYARNYLAGFGFERDKLPQALSLALGSTAVTPVKLVAAFATLANGGERVMPYVIERIEDSDGNRVKLPNVVKTSQTDDTVQAATTVEDNDIGIAKQFGHDNRERPRATSKQNAFLTRSMMQQVIRSGTARKALLLGRRDLAGKTGTTNGFRDAWFSGFIPEVATTVYIGFDTPAHLGGSESGARAALPIWIDFMGEVLPDYPERPVLPPTGIITQFINKNTGNITTRSDPNGYTEYFLANNAPTLTGGSSSATTTAQNTLPQELF